MKGELSYVIRFKGADGTVYEKEVSLGEDDIPTASEIDRDTYNGLRRDLHKIEQKMLHTRTKAEHEFLEGFVKEAETIKKKDS